MRKFSLSGRSILIVEDEAILAVDIASAFEAAGAVVCTAGTLTDALRLVEQTSLSAAVLDFGHDANALCERLRARDIPFILHSGYGHVGDTCEGGIVVPKPAAPAILIETVVGLLRARQPSPSVADSVGLQPITAS